MLRSSKQTETVGFEEENKSCKDAVSSYSASGSDTWKKYAETEGSWRSFVSAGKKNHEVREEGLGACRQERECRRENNQEGDL